MVRGRRQEKKDTQQAKGASPGAALPKEDSPPTDQNTSTNSTHEDNIKIGTRKIAPARKIKGMRQKQARKQEINTSTNIAQCMEKRNQFEHDTVRQAVEGPLTLRGALLVELWESLGGASNIVTRMDPEVQTRVKELLRHEKHAHVITMAMESEPDSFESEADVIHLYMEYLEEHYYSSATVRNYSFEFQEADIIHTLIGLDQQFDNGYEMPERDMPYLLQEAMLKHTVKAVEKPMYDYAKACRPSRLFRAGVYEACQWGVLDEDWNDVFIDGDADRSLITPKFREWMEPHIFGTKPFQNSRQASVEVWNVYTHKTCVTADTISVYVATAIETRRKFLDLRGMTEADSQGPEISNLDFIDKIARSWKTKSAKRRVELYPGMCKRIAAGSIKEDKIRIALACLEEERREKAALGKLYISFVKGTVKGQVVWKEPVWPTSGTPDLAPTGEELHEGEPAEGGMDSKEEIIVESADTVSDSLFESDVQNAAVESITESDRYPKFVPDYAEYKRSWEEEFGKENESDNKDDEIRGTTDGGAMRPVITGPYNSHDGMMLNPYFE